MAGVPVIEPVGAAALAKDVAKLVEHGEGVIVLQDARARLAKSAGCLDAELRVAFAGLCRRSRHRSTPALGRSIGRLRKIARAGAPEQPRLHRRDIADRVRYYRSIAVQHALVEREIIARHAVGGEALLETAANCATIEVCRERR